MQPKVLTTFATKACFYHRKVLQRVAQKEATVGDRELLAIQSNSKFVDFSRWAIA
ncbi:MAG: hypothetical protein NTY15_12835 [Planctomycetota bacterium]|nr:hypothetical protein [Planctomycetota bacterium]